MSNSYINGYCRIEDNVLYINGEPVFEQTKNHDFNAFAKALYKHLKLAYPKFHKMDNLSKLCFLSTEVLSRELEFDNNMAIVLSNHSSSLDIDRLHQESINDPENFYPSPANFVYTLPNIGMGEICIRHKIQGENAFFVSKNFNAQLLHAYCESLLQTGKCEQVLCGWADFDGVNAKSFLYLLTRSGQLEHTSNNLDYLYACNIWKN
ncbi:MAG: 3-oxoacyl-ACP synthase [Cytophagaceae bacterium]|nr:3-oxoacyl-ACP synthase [Cytophagaceae bacterium]|tara:strand:+ start:3177 stop:3797 length:621 start_codon:yes stop_codon:yes gene_type:complete